VQIKTTFELFCPNGADFAPLNIGENEWNEIAIDFKKEDAEQDYNNEILSIPAFTVQPLKPARFGTVHYSLRKNTTGTLVLDIMQPLEGNLKNWQKAKPALTWEYGDEKVELKKVPLSSMMTISVPFDENMINDQPVITAALQINPSVFDGILIEMPGLVTDSVLIPKLEPINPTQGASLINLATWGDFIPPDHYCTITAVKTGASDLENEKITKAIVYSPKGKGTSGMFNCGICKATVNKKKAGLKKGDMVEFLFKIVDDSGLDKKFIFNVAIKTPQAFLTVE
jgi:hypothetical protein